MAAVDHSQSFGDGGFRAAIKDSKTVLTPGGGISGELKKMPRSRHSGSQGGYFGSRFRNTMKVSKPCKLGKLELSKRSVFDHSCHLSRTATRHPYRHTTPPPRHHATTPLRHYANPPPPRDPGALHTMKTRFVIVDAQQRELVYKGGGRLGQNKGVIDLSGKYIQAEPFVQPLSTMFHVSQGIMWAAWVCTCAGVHLYPFVCAQHRTHSHSHSHAHSHVPQLHIFESGGGLEETLTLGAPTAADMRTWCTELNRSFGKDASAAADAASGLRGVGSLLRADSFSRSSRPPLLVPGNHPSMVEPEGPGSLSPERVSLAEQGMNLFHRATHENISISFGAGSSSGSSSRRTQQQQGRDQPDSRRSLAREGERPSLVRSASPHRLEPPARAPAPTPFRVGDRIECR